MENQKPLLFVRRASGLRRAITPWQSIFFGTATSATLAWHYYLMAIIPNWYPGVNLALLYALANAFVIFEDFSTAMIYMAVPRSGSSYLTMSRGLAPIIGMMEGSRSYLGDGIYRGANTYVSSLQFGGLMTVLGSLTGIGGLASVGAVFVQPMNALLLTLLFQVVGALVDGLGPGLVGKWTAVFGVMALVGWVMVMVPLIQTGPGGLQGSWDSAFGAGAYNEVITTSTTLGYTPAPFSWNAMGLSLLLPVSQTWPYCLYPVAGEVQDPGKSLPFSMIGAAVVIFCVNVSMAAAYTNTMGDFALRYNYTVDLLGKGSMFKINKIIPVSIATYSSILAVGNPTFAFLVGWAPQWSNFADMVLNVLWVSRPMFAISMDRMGPEWWTRVSTRWHSPYMGSIFWFVTSMITAWICTFSGALVGFVQATAWTFSFGRMFLHLSEAEIAFTKPHIWERALGFAPKLNIKGMPIMAITGSICAVVFLYIICTSPVNVGGALLIVLMYIVGALQFIYYANKNQKKGIEISSIYGELPPE